MLSPDEKAVAGARIILQVSDGSHPRTVQTGLTGRFLFSPLRPGLYDLRAQANGQWSDWEHNVLVRSGQQTDITLRLLLKKPPVNPAGVPATKSAPPPAKSSLR